VSVPGTIGIEDIAGIEVDGIEANNGIENGDGEEEEEEVAIGDDVKSVIRPADITYEQMAAAGLMAKRVLDQGRVQYLRALGLTVRQVQYCSPDLSPECMLILATRS
jgi:hypothetical protein